MYTLWYFAMNFLLSVIVARQLTQQEYGVFSILSTILTTLLLVFAFGLEDVATIFIPRALSAGGEGAAGSLTRRLMLGRALTLVMVVAALALLLPWGIRLLAVQGFSVDKSFLSSPYGSYARMALIAAFLIGSGVVTLENALFASMLRSRTTFIVGGLSQALNAALAALILGLGGGVDGLFLTLACVAWLTALAYLIPLRRLLMARGRVPSGHQPAMRGLMVTAWLANVTNGALGKQSDILLMGVFAVGYAAIGYYNLAYQLANILGVLLIAGLGGVGPAAMSAALGAGGRKRLAEVWRATMMLQIVLTIPVLAFGAAQADNIVSTLYGGRYAGAVPLLQIFLVTTLVGRLIGGGVQQSALYVLGRQRLVLFNRWLGLVINIGLDIILIPLYGPFGAAMATSAAQLLVGGVEHLLVRGNLPVRYPLALAGRVVGASALAAACLLWWPPRDILGLAASLGIFLLVLVAGLLVLGQRDGADARRVLELYPGVQARWDRLWNRTLGHDAGPAHDGSGA
jgi:O-antigen/teichoic acid export membrane protein